MREIKFRVYILQNSDITEGKDVGIMVYSDGRSHEQEKKFFCTEMELTSEWWFDKGKIMLLIPQERLTSGGDIVGTAIEAYPSNRYETDSGYIQVSEIMQYTGLKDKNGKEIYEGDIVKIRLISYEDEEVHIVAPVFYDLKNHRFAIDLSYLGEEGIDELYDKSLSFRSYFHVCFGDFNCFTDIEVIGNIYENPELLEVKK